jgi:ABC-type molybdate transport system ATPase subunit
LKKGISGGERKRTSIGVEIITDPSLIILDGKSLYNPRTNFWLRFFYSICHSKGYERNSKER